ncbi:MAG TPA: DUF4276 family protein [Terracidiphilus sp.]|nr:DUF4276 family protein [Terracidiphilus sp.]
MYVEGGGDNKDTIKRCNEGFAAYCKKLVPENRRPAIIACGGRNEAFDRFCIAVRNSRADDLCALLVDAECPVKRPTPEQHLHERDGWDFPVLGRHKTFLMVQAMEAWFLADREVLSSFYDGGFLAKSLPGSAMNIEVIRKEVLEPALKHASKPTESKGEYHKVKHGFALLSQIDPAKVEKASPHAAALHAFLRAL